MLGIVGQGHRCHRPGDTKEVSYHAAFTWRRGLTFDTIWAIKFSGRTISEAPPGRSVVMPASNMFRLMAAMTRHFVPQNGKVGSKSGVEGDMGKIQTRSKKFPRTSGA